VGIGARTRITEVQCAAHVGASSIRLGRRYIERLGVFARTGPVLVTTISRFRAAAVGDLACGGASSGKSNLPLQPTCAASGWVLD
jgi:hypothetical protein